MPTNEERREIAENLRNMTVRGQCRYAEQFYELLEETVMYSWDFHEFEDVAERLADLIEPEPERTCRMEVNWDYDGDCPAYYRDYVCSECKDDFIYYKHSRVNYCPNCGAKVV